MEAAYKQEICGSTTEEKPVTKEIIKFTKNKLKFKFFENKKDDMYSLRVNAKVIEGEKTWELF